MMLKTKVKNKILIYLTTKKKFLIILDAHKKQYKGHSVEGNLLKYNEKDLK